MGQCVALAVGLGDGFEGKPRAQRRIRARLGEAGLPRPVVVPLILNSIKDEG